MLYHYFILTLRKLWRNKTYSLLNITGLAVGIAACLLIFLVVRFESGFDDFHPNGDRIYRLVSIPYREGSPLGMGPGAPLPAARALRADFPAVEKAAVIFGRDGQITIPAGQDGVRKKFEEEGGVFYAEAGFFEIFSLPWLVGDAKSLEEPNTVVLTRETAIRYFGAWRGVIGKTIQFNNRDIFRVVGILQDMPANTDLPLRVVFSFPSLTNVDRNDWQGVYGRGYTFVRLRRGADALRLDRELRSFSDRHTPPGLERRGLMLQPLAEMHHDERLGTFTGRTFSRDLIRSLVFTAIFLLVIAGVNFVNLSTAQAVKRSHETGVRKVLVSGRGGLVLSFLGESVMLTGVALLIGVALAALALPFLDRLLGIELRLGFSDAGVWAFVAVVGAAATLMAGLYPAVVLSGFNPIDTLKNSVTVRGIRVRRALVGLQFGIAQVLIVCVLVVSGQMNFVRHATLGFDAASIVNVPVPGGDSLSARRMEVVRRELLAVPGVAGVCFSTFSPLDNDIWSGQFKFDHSKSKTSFQAYFKWADADFFPVYKPELIAGRVYGRSDTVKEYVVNETFVRQLGFSDPSAILGKEINIWDQLRGPVVGVVRDFHTNSMQKAITPVVMGCWRDAYGMAGIKLGGGDVHRKLAEIEKIWNSAYPDYVFSYQFLNDKIDDYYKEEGKLSQLYRVFAGIAILITCLGLYGLISFMAVQRTKEIGVRKVLGASVANVMLLLSKECWMLVGVAFAVAAPVAYWLMHRWLEGFAYRIRLDAGIFVMALAVSAVIAWATVGYRAFTAAVANPVKALRSE